MAASASNHAVELSDNNSASPLPDCLRAFQQDVIFSPLSFLQWRHWEEGGSFTRGSVGHEQKITGRNHFPMAFDFRFSNYPLPSIRLWHAVGYKWTHRWTVRACVRACACLSVSQLVCMCLCECACMISSPLHLLKGWPGFRCQALAWSGVVSRRSIHPE